MYGICKLSLVPVRAEASSKSEMTTQLLMGDIYQVLSQKEEWFFIETLSDKYTGWINHLQHFKLNDQSLIAVMVNAIKELNQKVDLLVAEIATLKGN